jgi:hypothetical protein
MERCAHAVSRCFALALALGGCSSDPHVIGRFLDEGCEAQEGAVFCSGFERPDLSDWSGTVVINAAELGQTESLRRSGRGALHAASTDHESAAAVAAEFPALKSGELFLRVYMYLPEGVETKTTNVLFLGDEPAPDPFKGVDFNFESDAPEIFVPENDPVRFTSTTVFAPRQRWFCYQVRLLISEDAGAVTIKVDGSVALEQTGLDTLSAGGVHLLRAGVDWSSKQTTPFSIYMDDLVLATSEVACD